MYRWQAKGKEALSSSLFPLLKKEHDGCGEKIVSPSFGEDVSRFREEEPQPPFI